jgi:hypothetical protein
MSEGTKCCAATPAKDLEDRIMNSNIPKSESEWWANREINNLRDLVQQLEAEVSYMEQLTEAKIEAEKMWATYEALSISQTGLLKVWHEKGKRLEATNKKLVWAVEGMLNIQDIWLPKDADEEHRGEAIALHMGRAMMIEALAEYRKEK